MHGHLKVGLCESIFLLLEYSIEYLIEYSSTQIPTYTGCDKLNVNGKCMTTDHRNNTVYYEKSWSLNSTAVSEF